MLKAVKAATAAVALLATAQAAHAGPPHILRSEVFTAPPADAAYAVAPALDAGTRQELTEALRGAGLSVVGADQPHAYLVMLWAEARPLCTRACSPLTGYDVGPLADHYRHGAMVAAQRTGGAAFDVKAPLAWATLLQSDGLSSRTADYLPTLLRYGSSAYARTTRPERPPRLSPPALMLPGVTSSPG